MKNVAIDFEYNHPSDPGMGLLSCALQVEKGVTLTYWLADPLQKEGLITILNQLKKDHVFIGYEIHLAEARCFAALGMNPNDFKWRDLMAEWRWLRSETNEYKYGHIVKNNVAMFTIPKQVRLQKRMTDDELELANEVNTAQLADAQEDCDVEVAFDEAGYSLLDCCYFFETITLDDYRAAAKVKETIRDGLIMSCNAELIESRKHEILSYNAADIKDMHILAAKLTEEMHKVSEDIHIQLKDGYVDSKELDIATIQLNLGDWCARTAKYAYRGIPINKTRLETFLKIVPTLTQEIKETWNRDYPAEPLYRVGLGGTILKARKSMANNSPYKTGTLTKDTAMLQDLIANYCKANDIDNWPKTRKGVYSTDKKTVSTFASAENIIKQYERHSGKLSNLKAFSVGKDGKVDALRYIGSDSRQRPDFAPHGTQTDRNAHKAKSLIFAMTHWMRILMDPEPGMAFVECDYGSEEIFIAAVLHGDRVMEQAYATHDFYVAYAQLVGMYPSDLPIPTEAEREAKAEWWQPYAGIRTITKTLCLSLQYGAGYKSVAQAIAIATKEPIDVDAAKQLVAEYHDTYQDLTSSIGRLKAEYQSKVNIVLPNGWRLGKDSQSILSACNVPVQGTGSCILQEACKRIDDAGIDVIATMHDAITVYCKEAEAETVAETMKQQMIDAAEAVLGKRGMKVGAPEIIKHGDWWQHGSKGKKDWELYKKYFI
jgi:hypothetical protein